MTIIEAIKQRESVRNYTGQRLSAEQISKIEDFIKANKAPFGINARIEFICAKTEEKATKLGTYGFISGAADYLALIYEDAPLADEGSAYLFEQVVLFCTQLGLGTCWLGGSFNRKDFKTQIALQENEKIRIVSPIGYKSDKTRFIDSLLKPKKVRNNPRKAFGAIFFDKDFSVPLTEDKAGIYAQPLEMVRLAPSANNKQSWRVVFDNGILHFYKTPSSGFSGIDMGIALCHFEQSCKELGISGKFETQNLPDVKSAKYVISWA